MTSSSLHLCDVLRHSQFLAQLAHARLRLGKFDRQVLLLLLVGRAAGLVGLQLLQLELQRHQLLVRAVKVIA